MKTFLSLCLVICLSLQAKSMRNNRQRAGKSGAQTPSNSPGNQGFPRFPGFPGLPKKCDTCGKLTTGFSQTLSFLQRIYEKLDTIGGPVTPCPPSLSLAQGSPSAIGDGATSVATCPDGDIVFTCRCSKENNACDGVEVTDNGNSCTAYNALGHTSPVQAIAQCAPLPEEGAFYAAGPQGSVFSANPVATCQFGSMIYSCFLHNPSAHNNLVQTELDLAAKACKTTSACSQAPGCRIQALCKFV